MSREPCDLSPRARASLLLWVSGHPVRTDLGVHRLPSHDQFTGKLRVVGLGAIADP
ncbi:hypothetical protein [Streptomyces europaeiscabiei]|uniref:hypothetical protein n=1 Tax=Streptomyces europaeiscabiei TaxID=146819 RepID=UPI0029A1AFDF|nr:hypothetical protein [Streptomyces europaeiscabiei]MDX2766693.1 hypothetical protein [Streptomyces europaeiscabiei]